MESNLKFYSLGIVLDNKPKNSDIILVTPIEQITIQNKEDILSNQENMKSEVKNIKNETIRTEIKVGNYIRARWLPLGVSNRITSPTVYKGETVILLKFSDLEEYYWMSIFREPKLRKKEIAHFAFSNIDPNNQDESINKENSYWFEISTIDKHIILKTSDNDQEKAKYLIKIDTKNGILTIEDNKDNKIHLDSVNGKLYIKSREEFNIESKNINIKANKIKIQSEENTIDSKNTNINNKTKVKELNATSQSKFKSNVTMESNLRVSGNVRASSFTQG